MNTIFDYHHCEDIDFAEYVEQLLLYRKVVAVREISDQVAELELDNGLILIAEGNEGCGGCGNGWYYLSALNTCDNAITKVEIVEECEEVFSIFVYSAEKCTTLISFEGGDNGYYGVGYTLRVKPFEKKA